MAVLGELARRSGNKRQKNQIKRWKRAIAIITEIIDVTGIGGDITERLIKRINGVRN